MSIIQVIDESKRFAPDVQKYFKQVGISNAGLKYHVIAVFGSQSTGKSTLLNALFGTEFGVMDASARQQTTKGIWMGAELPNATDNKEPLLILDVEGTDGRERGEDQDFERKAALFALATSEVLIINMWEHQVGLYVGANMALLRTVFEVNLSLFQAARGQQQRSRILFVIRDHMGLTPLSTLAATLKDDLEKQWDALSKPESLQSSRISDFFDLEFAALPHKVLQADEFAKGVRQLRAQLDPAIKPEYHRNVPIDGWPMYAEQVWQQIEMNKDLDLPTHQILVARFRCEEIAAQSFNEFESGVTNLNLPFGDNVVIPEFGPLLKEKREAALKLYDETAGRYHPTVYNEKRIELLGRLDGVLTAYFGSQLAALKEAALAKFHTELEASRKTGASSLTFRDHVNAAAAAARSQFEAAANESVIDPSFFSYHTQLQELDAELERASAQARDAELRRLLKRVTRLLGVRLDPVDLHFSQFPQRVEHPWDAVEETLKTALSSIKREYPEDFGLGGSDEETRRAALAIESLAWRELANRITAMTKTDAVLQKLRDRFEDSFKYTEDGLPVVWSPGDDIDEAAVKARKSALELLPALSTAKLSNGEILSPPSVVIESLRQQDEDVPEFVVLINAQQQQDIERRFQRLADAAFVDAKRSVMQLQTHIPAYIFVLLAVLGWNEFTMVLRNPLFLLLALMLGAGFYVVHSLGLTSTILNILEGSFEKGVEEAKEYLRKFLLSDEERQRIAKREQPHAVAIGESISTDKEKHDTSSVSEAGNLE